MSELYTYTSSVDFANDLSFDHIETYSFQRGAAFEQELASAREKYRALQLKQDDLLTTSERIYLAELGKLHGIQYLLDEHGKFQSSAKKISSFAKGSPAIDRLIEILNTPVNDIPRYMCAPVYRDAIVFYNEQGTIVSVLNVCLTCRYMETKPFHHIDADSETYDQLKQFFLGIGHDVKDIE